MKDQTNVAIACYYNLSHEDRKIFWLLAGQSKDTALRFLIKVGGR